MTLVVSLRDVVDEMEGLTDIYSGFINRKTGELITLSIEVLSIVEEDEPIEDLPEWEQEIIPKVREVLESDDFIKLPTKYDIHEWSIMERFCCEVEDPDQSDRLLSAIHRKGAFGRFKDNIHRFGIVEDWYRFREAALEKIAIDFLEENGIAFRREQQ